MKPHLPRALIITFYLIILILPVNLGKHFIFDFSYVDGVLIDYWIPTVFIQDVLILVFLVFSVLLRRFKVPRLFFALLILLFVNLVFSVVPLATLSYSLRMALYTLFFICVVQQRNFWNYTVLLKLLYISVCLICFLALFQWFKQGAVFSNYIFFGEQPYSLKTSGILKQSVFNNLVVSPYATFRHPNALAGFLSVTLLLFAYYIKGTQKHFILFIGSIVLFLTFSFSAWLSFLFGLLFISTKSSHLVRLYYLAIFFIFVVGIFGLFDTNTLNSNILVHRRFLLSSSAAHTFLQNPLVGTGINTSLFTAKDLFYMSRELTFFQPVHNVFWLLLTEGGLLLFIPFVFFYLYVLSRAHLTSRVYQVFLLQFVILGSFDHYLFTMHQTLLLFMLTISFSIPYTFKHEI